MPYSAPVQSIDDEDVKDMQVNKYKLGKQIAEFESLFGGERVFKIIPKTGGRLDIFEEDLIDWGATPLIESEPGIEKLKSDKFGTISLVELGLIPMFNKINELVDAINALQKGSK